MLAKMTSKNQITLPRSMTASVGSPEYFDVEARSGQIVLTPVRMHRHTAARAKLTEPDLLEQDILDEVNWEGQVPAAKNKRGK